MQGIEFEEDKDYQQLNVAKVAFKPVEVEREPSALTKALFKIGVKNQVTANYILLGISIVFFGIAIFFYDTFLDEYEHEKARPVLTAEEQTEQLKIAEEMRSPKNL